MLRILDYCGLYESWHLSVYGMFVRSGCVAVFSSCLALCQCQERSERLVSLAFNLEDVSPARSDFLTRS